MIRQLPILISLCAFASAQDLTLHSQSELVVTPAAIADRHGAPVEGLSGDDLVLYDNNVPRAIHVDDVSEPISLVLVVQSTVSAHPVLEKLRKEASLFEPLIAGDRGEMALVTFAQEVKVRNAFTSEFDSIAKSLRNLDAVGGGASVNDAVSRAIRLFETRPLARRRVILLIAEKHDRSSQSHVEQVVAAAQKANITIYPVTFSPSFTPYTAKAPTYCNPPPQPRLDKDVRKCRDCSRECGMCARQCFRDEDDPPELPPAGPPDMNLLAVFVELKRLAQTNLASAFANSSGGVETGFLRKEGLEKALEKIGTDLHTQYLISFQPDANSIAGFHKIRVEVRGRPELVVRTRPGYWKTAGATAQ
jgi:VWFA-related protein